MQCDSRDGDTISRLCLGRINFTFQLANGACSQDANVSTATPAGNACDVIAGENCPTVTP